MRLFVISELSATANAALRPEGIAGANVISRVSVSLERNLRKHACGVKDQVETTTRGRESVAGSGEIGVSIGDRTGTHQSVRRPADTRGERGSAAVRKRSGRCCSATSPEFSPPEAVPSRPGARGHPRAHRRDTIIPLRTVRPWSR